MTRFIQPLLLYIAAACDKTQAAYIEFLQAQLRMTRERLPEKITVTPAERAELLKLGKPLGAAVKELLSIVSPRTFARWVNAENQPADKPAANPKGGRPRVKQDIREVVLRLASENGWGYTRIIGELKKLAIKPICRSSVANILKEGGFDPGPKRGKGTWNEFIQQHAATLWACDFFSKKVWTTSGLVEYFVLFFVHVGSRRVHIAGMTPNPSADWVGQQARNVSQFFAEQPVKPTYILRDYDSKFGQEFDAVFKAEDITVKKVGPRAPNLNAVAERWVQSIRRECLDHFIVFGEEHLRYIIREYETHYNEHRPHQWNGNRPLTAAKEIPAEGEILCDERLGGRLKHYYRKTA